MITDKNGGPAFPVIADDIASHMGMSLRDYFAAHIIGHLAVNQNTTVASDAEFAYELADAMLKERAK